MSKARLLRLGRKASKRDWNKDAKQNGWPIRDYRIRGNEAVRKGVPAAAAAGVAVGVAVGVAKGIQAMRERGGA